MLEAGELLAELRRRLSPVVYSSGDADVEHQRVHLRVRSLDAVERSDLAAEAAGLGLELQIEEVGFCLADQLDLKVEVDRLRRTEPTLGIDVVALHPDGRVWVTFRGDRAQIATRLRGLAGENRIFLAGPAPR